MPAHDAGLTGVRDVVSTDNDPTAIIVQRNNVDLGVDTDEDGDDDNQRIVKMTILIALVRL